MMKMLVSVAKIISIIFPFLTMNFQEGQRTYLMYDSCDKLTKVERNDGSSSFYFYDPARTE